MEQRSAGELTAAEKYIIKSRLGIAFWKAEETASFICSFHREKMLEESNMQNCSVCNKRRSKKLDYYIITYRYTIKISQLKPGTPNPISAGWLWNST